MLEVKPVATQDVPRLEAPTSLEPRAGEGRLEEDTPLPPKASQRALPDADVSPKGENGVGWERRGPRKIPTDFTPPALAPPSRPPRK